MLRQAIIILMTSIGILGLTACSSNDIIGNEQQSNVEATEENMLTISRGIINNLGSLYTVNSREEADRIIRRNIITEEVYYRGFLEFFKDGGTYEEVSVDLSNETVANLVPNNVNTIGTILYTFDIKVSGTKEDGTEEVIGEEDNLMVQIANYQGHFRMIEIRKQ